IIDEHNIPVLRLKNEEVLEHLPQALKKMEKLLLPRLIPGPSPDGGEGSTALIAPAVIQVFPGFPFSPIGREVAPQSRSEAT
ncbi:MAG: hypothetical protein PHZ00_03810, partial [Candidatus Peribacteraceae bacterium]|nr:hypothetical protein [Candidatus Peribacteraceae bacterium]